MLKQVWHSTRSFDRGARIERHECRDGSSLYSFIDRFGKPHNATEAEAMKVIKEWCMKDVTEDYRLAGWIA